MNFPFYDYEYYLDVTKQHEIMPDDIDMAKGLKEAADWYMHTEKGVEFVLCSKRLIVFIVRKSSLNIYKT